MSDPLQTWPKQELLISYAQLAVYASGLSNPFPEWTDRHLRQGFAWRPGSVSFAALEDVHSEIMVSLGGKPAPDRDAVRAISVPFTVTGGGGITVSSILSRSYSYDLPHGSYELLFQAVPLPAPEPKAPKVRYLLHFTPNAQAEAQILKRDQTLAPTLPLLMEAEPAVS
ncbi:competence protein J [Paenibacillus mucilaginosus 3016]|uniref:Competence protein J n=2 Tax=Paenibacillus mucilaginosus TaxID=61624 RepID=H6NM84_9BACL|nr:competence protein ComJ [Paenibacillus mucilaginosus]AFC33246.1 competence protein J [Paenibacillus mucilaginosus 3016]AFH65559.1 competence protein [Paenibacillus mucilaginosus K02]WFA21672.1 competence protein [Paenibacillus mucilaginosus]